MEKRIQMNISLTKKENTFIKELKKEEERPYSRQIVYMTNFYMKNNKLREKRGEIPGGKKKKDATEQKEEYIGRTATLQGNAYI